MAAFTGTGAARDDASVARLAALAADDPKELTAPPALPHHALVIVVPSKAVLAPERPVEAVAKAGAIDAKPQAISPRRQPFELPSPRTVDPPLESLLTGLAPAAVRPRAISHPETVATAAEISRASHQDTPLPPPRQLAEIAAPRPQQPAEYRVERKPLDPDTTAAQVQAPSPAPADEHAQVNIDELRTRIEGINLSLRNLDAELHEKRDFSPDQLDSLLSRLDILVLRQKDLTLFRDLTTPQEQAKVGQIDSSRPAITSMGNRISELRIRIRENGAMPEAERTAALKHLDELSDRLAALTAEK